MRDGVNTHHDKLIRRWENYYRKKQNQDNEIVFIKINFIEHRKGKNFKNEQKKKFKNKKKCYNCDKKDHFARDCRLKNKENRQQINVLIKVFDKTEVQKKESEINISEINTNDEDYRIEDVNKLQKVLNETASDKTLMNTEQINEVIRQAFLESKTSYSYKKQSKSDSEYEWDEDFETQLQEFKKKFVEKLKLTDLETIEIIKEIFIKKNVESNMFTHELIMKKLTRIMWR